MKSLRLFSQTTKRTPFRIQTIKSPGSVIDQLLMSTFSLAKHFISTEKNKPDWRNTLHQVYLATTQSKPVAFSGMEIGDGKIIQRYIGEFENNTPLFHDKTLFVHAMEVLPEYRGHGIQMLLWKKICEHALSNDINSIIWDPRDEEAYLCFFAKFNLVPNQHTFTQMTCLGNYSDGDSNYDRHLEDFTTIFQIERSDFVNLHKNLLTAIQQLNFSKENQAAERPRLKYSV